MLMSAAAWQIRGMRDRPTYRKTVTYDNAAYLHVCMLPLKRNSIDPGVMNATAQRLCAAMPLRSGRRRGMQGLVTLQLQQRRHSTTHQTRFKLNTGAEIPAIGFGTFHGEGDVAEAVA